MCLGIYPKKLHAYLILVKLFFICFFAEVNVFPQSLGKVKTLIPYLMLLNPFLDGIPFANEKTNKLEFILHHP